MLQTEYVRSLNCNYERILLDRKPEDSRYQYCILSRGGIKGLLPCSLRYLNGQAYLYYDISSRQNIARLYGERRITRDWMKDFTWALKKIRQELERFLLDTCNILWYPEQIFQDLESNIFSFLYVPYYEGEASFIRLAEFWVEHIDYDDEVLVDFVYKVYEQLEKNGESYLQSRIFEDMEVLEKAAEKNGDVNAEETFCRQEAAAQTDRYEEAEERPGRPASAGEMLKPEAEEKCRENTHMEEIAKNSGKRQRGILGIFEAKRERGRKLRDNYRQEMQEAMTGYAAEETVYKDNDYGKTVYIEENVEKRDRAHKLYTPEGRIVIKTEKTSISIGKKKGEVDVVLDDPSVSRMHACITMENGNAYLEDLNSTNGTFKNGLRLQPYEKRKLDEEDEIKFGKIVLIFR